MNSLTVRNAAKINLALDVTGLLENGYHTIESIFQTVGLYDEVTVSLTDSGITVNCDVPGQFAEADEIPCDERNIAYKAAKLFFDHIGKTSGCNIYIKKGIPSQAGMGGGSSDAAAVLFILNQLTGSEISTEKLSQLGAKIGADVPFFLTGGTAYVNGIGEIITPISDYSGKMLVIAKGSDGVSTAEAYHKIDSLENPVHPNTNELVNAINSNSDDAPQFFGNLFEQAVKLSSVKNIRAIMNAHGAAASVMTGSGSAVFGLFYNENSAENCVSDLSEKGFFAQFCQTVNRSFELL